ncbi:hypothetical protein AB7M43_006524 [Bradyrhizobium elkanii]
MARCARPVAAGDRQPPGRRRRLHFRRTTPRSRHRSAGDACAGAVERRDSAAVSRHRAEPDPGAAAVRPRQLSRRAAKRCAGQPVDRALSGRLPRGRFLPCRCVGLRCRVLARPRCRRRPAAADICQAGRGADFRLDPGLRPRRPAWRQGRAGQDAGRAVSGPAPLHSRGLCPLRLHPLRDSLCRVDPVPRQRAAAEAAGLPRGLSGRRALSEGLAHRRRPAVTAAQRRRLRHRRAARRAIRRLRLPPERRHRRGQRRPQATRPATPTSPSIRRSAFRSRRRRPSRTRNPSPGASPARPSTPIPGRTISARRAASRSANAPAATAIRARTSGLAHVRSTARMAAIPSSRRSLRCATAS